MSDDPVRTMVETAAGLLEFQDYFVRRRTRDAVRKVLFHGSEKAKPAAGVLNAITHADAVVICPSNPIISIGPILAVPGIRQALRAPQGSNGGDFSDRWGPRLERTGRANDARSEDERIGSRCSPIL